MPFLILPMVFWIVLLVGGFTLAARLVRAYEQRSAGGGQGQADALQDRVIRLEETIESMNVELSRLAEAQQFTTRLLEGQRVDPERRPETGEAEPGPG